MISTMMSMTTLIFVGAILNAAIINVRIDYILYNVVLDTFKNMKGRNYCSFIILDF